MGSLQQPDGSHQWHAPTTTSNGVSRSNSTTSAQLDSQQADNASAAATAQQTASTSADDQVEAAPEARRAWRETRQAAVLTTAASASGEACPP